MADAAGWQPSATVAALRSRAELLDHIRRFFAAREILEVETPLLSACPATDPNLDPLKAGERWLQTSPEYLMKRLLAAGAGPVYQICKAFRGQEYGDRHNPEFTLLEWYRPGYELQQLIEEVGELVCEVLDREGWECVSYRELFLDALGLDPFVANLEELEALARGRLDINFAVGDRDDWLDLLLSHLLEPQLRHRGLVFVCDFPASQASLSRVRRVDGHDVAERFELYADGLELANGFRELTDSAEQRQRFAADLDKLEAAGKSSRPLDERLLQALDHGLPECSGVALGVDRLLMLRSGASSLGQVISFDWARA